MEEIRNTEPSINLVEVFKKLSQHKKLYYKVLPATLVITYLITLFVPRYYKCTVSLAPERNGSTVSGSFGDIASSFGLGTMANMGTSDALYSDLYPDIIQTNDFLVGLMPVEVTTQDGDVRANYYVYLRDHQKSAWWSAAISMVKEWFDPTPKDTSNGVDSISLFNLSKAQNNIFRLAGANIKCTIDKKTDVISITVKDQDPLISATMAEATCTKLQEFIVNYRTTKAKGDFEYYKKVTEECKQDYDELRRQYVAFSDSHQDMQLTKYKARQEDYENELMMRYNTYSGMNSQMQAARAKLQEATPAFTVFQSASVPVKPAGPRRMIISFLVTILAAMFLTYRILAKKDA